jgi:hypothetical protein
VARCSNWPVYEVYGGNFLCSLKEQKLDELVQEVVQAGEGCLQIQHCRKHHLASYSATESAMHQRRNGLRCTMLMEVDTVSCD